MNISIHMCYWFRKLGSGISTKCMIQNLYQFTYFQTWAKHLNYVLPEFKKLRDLETYMPLYMLWFSFILGLNFFSL